MNATPDQLPNDIEEMKRLYLAQAAELAAAKAGLMIYALEIEKLKFQLARLRRQKYGSSSERIEREIAQLELKLEEIEAAKAEAEAKGQAAAPATPAAPDAVTTDQPAPAKSKKPRRKFPEHLPRTTVVHPYPHACPTPGCDGTLRKVGEDRTQILEYIPGHFKVREEVRPAGSCNKCGSMVQAPMPPLPIPRTGGRQLAGPRGGREVLRSPPALSAIRDLRPRRRRPRPLAARRLDGQDGMAAAAAGREDRRARHGGDRNPRRRHPRQSAGTGQRQDQDRPLLGVPARSASAWRIGAAGRGLPLHPGPQG